MLEGEIGGREKGVELEVGNGGGKEERGKGGRGGSVELCRCGRGEGDVGGVVLEGGYGKRLGWVGGLGV